MLDKLPAGPPQRSKRCAVLPTVMSSVPRVVLVAHVDSTVRLGHTANHLCIAPQRFGVESQKAFRSTNVDAQMRFFRDP